MTKLIIQIPCYNEEESLGVTLTALPRQLPGVDIIEWLIINDGSQDRTVELWRKFKCECADKIVIIQNLEFRI